MTTKSIIVNFFFKNRSLVFKPLKLTPASIALIFFGNKRSGKYLWCY